MHFLVTGIAGFIGSHIAERCLSEGHQVTGVDNLSNGAMENVPNGAAFVFGDLADSAIVSALPRDVDMILHLAGQASGENSFYETLKDLQQNAATTINLVKYADAIGARKFIFASSTSVYGDSDGPAVVETMPCKPKSCYAISKLAAEQYIRLLCTQVPWVIFRLSNVYGPRQNLANRMQGMVSIYLAQALETGRIQVKGSLDRFRDFIEISDVVDAWWLAVTTDAAVGQTMNLSTGRATTVREVLDELHCQIPNLEWYVEGSTPGDHPGYFAPADLAKRILGFESRVSLREGCRDFVNWARAQMGEQSSASRPDMQSVD